MTNGRGLVGGLLILRGVESLGSVVFQFASLRLPRHAPLVLKSDDGSGFGRLVKLGERAAGDGQLGFWLVGRPCGIT